MAPMKERNCKNFLAFLVSHENDECVSRLDKDHELHWSFNRGKSFNQNSINSFQSMIKRPSLKTR